MQTTIVGIVVVIVVVVIIVVYQKFGRPKSTGLRYFLPHQVVLFIRHPEAIQPEDKEKIKISILEAMSTFLQPKGESSENIDWRNSLEPPIIESIITFSSFSLVPIQVKGYDIRNNMDPRQLMSILRDAYADLRENRVLDLGNNLVIESISPNWLMSNLHHGGATGGPGSRPAQASAPSSGVPNFRVFNGARQLLPNPPTALPAGANVIVAILDSAPTAESLVDAYHNKWPNHPVLQELFGQEFKGGKLTIHYASLATLYDMEHFSPALHEYLKPDHGTFIAGVINSNAPAATLHLYQVLSRYGVGTFTSIARGLSDAVGQLGRPLIINCSFQFCLPDGTFLTDLIADLGTTLNGLTDSMRETFEGIIDPNIVIVAAAGNDSPDPTINPNWPHRVPARFPAAFNNVIGVGALKRGSIQNLTSLNIRASYSNFADDPPANGVMTLGGENSNGVLGMYISDFPNSWIAPNSYIANNTGWAWWAGTSFAAAIVSGFLAGRWCGPNQGLALNFAAAQAELNIQIQPTRTSDGERVIHVEQ